MRRRITLITVLSREATPASAFVWIAVRLTEQTLSIYTVIRWTLVLLTTQTIISFKYQYIRYFNELINTNLSDLTLLCFWLTLDLMYGSDTPQPLIYIEPMITTFDNLGCIFNSIYLYYLPILSWATKHAAIINLSAGWLWTKVIPYTHKF